MVREGFVQYKEVVLIEESQEGLWETKAFFMGLWE